MGEPSDPEELYRSIQERLMRVRSMISAEEEPKGASEPERSEEGSEMREAGADEESSTQGEAEGLWPDSGASAPPWPAWAVVDWTQAWDEDAPRTLRGLSDVAVPVMDEEEIIRIEDPQPIEVGSTEQADPTTAPPRGVRPEVVHRPSAAERGLAIPPSRLADLLREASFAAQEARERAARSAGEARVLREELERERVELGRERAEREHLMVQLARRRRWWWPSS
jgi:hypothetical protein